MQSNMKGSEMSYLKCVICDYSESAGSELTLAAPGSAKVRWDETRRGWVCTHCINEIKSVRWNDAKTKETVHESESRDSSEIETVEGEFDAEIDDNIGSSSRSDTYSVS